MRALRYGPESVAAVEHYLRHDEYEMALEGLCIDLLKLPHLSPAVVRRCIDLAHQVGLP